jgi:hypothetical protein
LQAAEQEKSMKNVIKVVLAGSFLSIAACDVDTKGNVAVPNVDVNVSGGELPDVNVTGPDVKVGTKNETVQVPTIDVDVPKENAQ